MRQIRHTNQKENTASIDAKGKTLGRLACEIALLLQGKDEPTFEYHTDEGKIVEVSNISELRFTGNKFAQKLYWHFTGYPGGIHSKKLEDVWQKDPGEILRRAVYGMLPKNKLRAPRMKRLRIKT